MPEYPTASARARAATDITKTAISHPRIFFSPCNSNLGRALTAAGARPEHVARITIYVVNYKRDECLPIIENARKALFGGHKPADVVLGVAMLSPGYLIEVDAIAVID